MAQSTSDVTICVMDDFGVAQAVMTLLGSGGAGLGVGTFMRWLVKRDEEQRREKAEYETKQAREQFLELRHDVKTLLEQVGEHKKVFEDVVEVKLNVKAMHKRQDEFSTRLERLENKTEKRR